MAAVSRRASADDQPQAAMDERTRPSGREWLIRGLFAVLVATLAVVVAATLLTQAEDEPATEGWDPGSNRAPTDVAPAWTSSTSP